MANEKRLIDANALGNGIALYVAENAYLNDTPLDVLKMVADWIAEAPTVNAVEVVHGRWIPEKYEDEFLEYVVQICSKCGCPHSTESNFCSYCGAKMDGDGND